MSASFSSIRGSLSAVRGKLIEQGKAGISIEPENADELVEAIKFLYHNRKEYQKLGDCGYHYVKENFDRKKLASLYEATLLKLTDR